MSSASSSSSCSFVDSSGEGLTVLVTGGSGFIAGWIIVKLLRLGYKVRTTVRNADDPKTKELIKNLQTTAGDEIKQEIECFSCDLIGSSIDEWSGAIKGSDFVIHCASPFSTEKVKDEEISFIKPAREGTVKVLSAAAQAGGVKRVVLTSSVASVAYGHTIKQGEKKIYNESDWTIPANVDGYIKSKVVAERAAWDLLENENKFELVTICPSYVQGALLSSKSAASQDLIKKILDKEYPMLPEAVLNMVDVQDVAVAHVRALRVPQAAGQRYILNATGPEEMVKMTEIAQFLASEYNPRGFSVPTRKAPYWLLKLSSFFDGSIRILLDDIKFPKAVDGSKASKDLGINYIKWKDSVKAMGDACIKFKLIKKLPKNLQ
jgi:dihydroflavonol-4-reductase